VRPPSLHDGSTRGNGKPRRPRLYVELPPPRPRLKFGRVGTYTSDSWRELFTDDPLLPATAIGIMLELLAEGQVASAEVLHDALKECY
jgi:hypothetical protein